MPSAPIASELSYLVLQARRRRGELGPCALDSSHQRLYAIPSAIVVREAFAADREAIPDSYQGGFSHTLDLVPVRPFHAGRER
jgi:hypothetical protein